MHKHACNNVLLVPWVSPTACLPAAAFYLHISNGMQRRLLLTTERSSLPGGSALPSSTLMGGILFWKFLIGLLKPGKVFQAPLTPVLPTLQSKVGYVLLCKPGGCSNWQGWPR